MADWLTDFVEYSSHGESPPKFMFWTGVATIAGALRRKVWIDQINFQWTPNFYILLVGPPGGPKKSTSIHMGLNLLRRVPGIDFGPQIVTWQQLITHMAESRATFDMPDGTKFDASCVTISVSEFGSFFDPLNRELVDNLTDIWDGKLGTIKKETRTMGSDEIVNPWLNIIAATTPGWIGDNFSAKLVRGGFASRPIYLYEDKPIKDIAYPSRNMREQRERAAAEDSLVERLVQYADLAGPFIMTDEAYEWGEQWYIDFRNEQRSLSQTEAGFYERKQTHLHKLAMVLCVSRGGFPTITVDDLKLADAKLRELEPDVQKIFKFVGQSRLSTAASELMDIMSKHMVMKRSTLFRRFFFRTMSSEEFAIALDSAVATGEIVLEGPVHDQQVRLK